MRSYQDLISKMKIMYVIGLGYVGFPVAFASKFKVIGFFG